MFGLTPSVPLVPTRMVWPSGAACFAAITPGMPPPPARFSTATPCPHFTESRSATMRAKMSAACPGGNGTITRTGFAG